MIHSSNPDGIQPSISEVTEKYNYNLRSIKACFSSARFWQYSAMIFLSIIYSAYFNNLYNEIGLFNHISDKAMFYAVITSSFLSMPTKIFIGHVYKIILDVY